MYNKTKLLTAALALVSIVSFGQEKDKGKLTLSGSVDVYYQTNLTASDRVEQINNYSGGGYTFGTSFADETGFALGMANVIAGYENGKTGVVIDAAIGPRADAAVGGYSINQLYAYWNVSDKVTLTAGRFNTYLGYEVISPTGNFNYSTSYLFSSGPFSHVGLKADIALSDDFSLMLAAMNVTDTNNNMAGEYSFGAQLGYKGQFLNFYYDGQALLGFEIDYTGGFDVTEEFFLGINAAYANNDGSGFYGAALYPQYSISDDFALGLRGEYFSDHSDVDGFDSTGVLGLTLTGSYSVNNLTIKPEVRLDSWNNDAEPFFDNDLETTNSLGVFTIAAIYSF